LLAGAVLGRLVTCVGSRPEIFPVNFVVQRPTVLFRTAEGTKLLSVVIDNHVAFEADGHSVAPAGSMREFGAALGHLDPQTLQYHLERGDFSRWLDRTIADTDLAAQVAAWEDELLAHRAADLERIRQQLLCAVEDRYLEATSAEHSA
jgi:hypothetical protein